MIDRTRRRINAAFDDELSSTPVPPSLRALSVRAAVASPPRRSRQLELLALVAALLVIAIVATLVIGTRALRSTPIPARPGASLVPPAPTANAASAFDARHGELVIFGGFSGPGANAPTNETWTWDGKYWRHLRPSASPTARSGAVMAFDVARGQVVLFGGSERNNIPVDDTWKWDGSTWRRLNPVHHPMIGHDMPATMQFDPVTKTILLFGFTSFATTGTPAEPQIWSWNGSDWNQITPSSPPAAAGPLLSDGRHVLLLEPRQVGGRYLIRTWLYGGDNIGWAVLKPRAYLPELGDASGAYDPVRNQLVLLNGDTWTWDGSTWTRQHPALQPLTAGYMAYVPSLHEVVSWGDRTASLDNEMFGWDGSDWKLIAPGSAVWPVNNGKGSFADRMSPDQAAATVRATVKNTHPVLLPAFLPSGGPFDAFVSVTPDDFNIRYESDQRDKTITFGIVVANPPPGTGAHASDTRVKFRNAVGLKYSPVGYVEYFVYDTTDPLSQRWLMWNEPGTMTASLPSGNNLVPYFLSAGGLTDAEFWQIANSLQ